MEGSKNSKEIPSVVGNYFVLSETLGEGTFGHVRLGMHQQTNKKVALKFIDMKGASERAKMRLQREIRIMNLLDHPNVVGLDEVIALPDGRTCLVLEYVRGGDLYEHIVQKGRLSEAEAIPIFRQLISAIEFTHSHLVTHRDLKPENILLDENQNVKINDFGLSNLMLMGSFLRTSCGSPQYTAPEILLGTEYLGPEVDVWSLGVILYVMVTGCFPWEGATIREKNRQLLKGNFLLPPYLSEECLFTISRMLCVDSSQRATLQELRRHEWVNRGYSACPPSVLPPLDPVGDIDFGILSKLEGLGFDKKQTRKELKEAASSQAVTLYRLMVQAKAHEMERLRKQIVNIRLSHPGDEQEDRRGAKEEKGKRFRNFFRKTKPQLKRAASFHNLKETTQSFFRRK